VRCLGLYVRFQRAGNLVQVCMGKECRAASSTRELRSSNATAVLHFGRRPMRLSVILLVGSLVGTVACSQVYLRDTETKLLYGPVDSRAGTRFRMPGSLYETAQPSPDEIAATIRLQDMIVPDVNFTNASVFLVAEYMSACFKGTNALLFRVDAKAYIALPRILDLCTLSAENKDQIPLVTLRARYISCLQLLDIVSRATFLPVHISGNNVILTQSAESATSGVSPNAK